MRPNLTFEFEFQNSKIQNSNEFERIRPSLQEPHFAWLQTLRQ
jgi:hypothetical protein